MLNTTPKERTKGKPHIAFIAGWWRVSAPSQNTCDLYYQAHAFVCDLNAKDTGNHNITLLKPLRAG